jgi:sulfate transport system substrate-binding protein
MSSRQSQKKKSWMKALKRQMVAIMNRRNWQFQPLRRKTNQGFVLLLTWTLSVCLFMSACIQNTISPTISPASQTQLTRQQRKPIELTLVSFAVTRAAYTEIIPLFQQRWRREHNQEVRFRHSFAGSSTQTRAVINGLPTDVVHLALAPDVNEIQKAGLIQPGWEKRLSHKSIVTHTVGAIVTRGGNPKQIRTWSDMTKPGVSVITADPKTSGIARWNFLAFWGSVTQTGGTEVQALDFVTRVFRNVQVLAKDAREATDLFLRQHQGDVLINYENELILAAQEGLAKDAVVIIPKLIFPSTIRSQSLINMLIAEELAKLQKHSCNFFIPLKLSVRLPK